MVHSRPIHPMDRYKMNATKRKFNNLLQGLGTPSNSSPTAEKPNRTTKDVETLLQKRRRLGIPQSNSAPLSSLTKSTTIANGTRKKTEVKKEEKPLARFCPSDRDQLLRRLATFNDITDWTPKPDRVNEVEWAKRGWVCHGKETVRCVLCHKELVVKLNKKEVEGKEVRVLVSSEIEEALVDKYVELIVSSHFDECLWKQRGCEDSLLRLPLASTSAALVSLRERYDELCTRKPFLPYEFNLRLPDGFDLDTILADLPADFFKAKDADAETPEPPNRTAIALALVGWQGLSDPRIGSVPNSASCHTCQRRLGLWMFKSKEVDDNGDVLVPAPMDFLDPVREHRFFCPWKNPQTQKRTTSKPTNGEAQPGWKILKQTLENDANLQNVYAGKPRSRPQSGYHGAPPATPTKGQQNGASTPAHATPATTHATPGAASSIYAIDDEDEEKEREAKNKERWARLKRVKSLFDIRGARRGKSSSRPGTAHSTKTNGDAKT